MMLIFKTLNNVKELYLLASRRTVLAASFIPASCLAYSSTLIVEGTCYSENSADFQRTTRCYISEDRTHRNFKSYIMESCAQILLTSMAQTGANHSLAQDVVSLKCLSEPWLGRSFPARVYLRPTQFSPESFPFHLV
jgi:hypothetical protein